MAILICRRRRITCRVKLLSCLFLVCRLHAARCDAARGISPRETFLKVAVKEGKGKNEPLCMYFYLFPLEAKY